MPAPDEPLTFSGLTQQEAQDRFQQEGPNELPEKNPRTFLKTTWEILSEPMFALLMMAGMVYLILGEIEDAAVLMGFVIISIGLTIFQQTKSDRALESLKTLAAPKAWVIRDGRRTQILSREIVRGDLLFIEEGDRIPADIKLIETHDLQIDESLLTGEALPVEKNSTQINSAPTTDIAYSGTLVVRGNGKGIVTQIGLKTEMGLIGKSLTEIKKTQSPLSLEIKTLIRSFATIGIFLSTIVWIIYGLTKENWLQGLLAGITMAMSLLPEEFTVILTVFMAIGVWRISRQHVLTRHPPVIETLGNVNVLCVDKTGTLTENRMSLKQLATLDSFYEFRKAPQEISEPFRNILKYALLASEIEAFDPMEKAFQKRWESIAPPEEKSHFSQAKLVHEYPLTPQRLAIIHLWKFPDNPMIEVAAKGAPETLMRLCKLNTATQARIQQQIELLAHQGMRVLGVAKARHSKTDGNFPGDPHEFEFEWLGLVGLEDPLRPEIQTAVQACHDAGIQVLMITGDHAVTAQAIAKEAGIPHEKYLSGDDLESLSDSELIQRMANCHLFVRIKPQQKLRIVHLLQSGGLVVGMTGDGINDAPALKAAHIGISMGKRGTDVAREASSLVLLNDDFSSIVHAIRLGRRIYENLRKAMVYLVAVHVPIAGAVFIPLVLGLPPILTPIHILFLEIIIDPACAIVFENESADAQSMLRPPRKLGEKIFNLKNMAMAFTQGIGLLFFVIGINLLILHLNGDPRLAATLSFATLVLGNLSLIIASRSSSEHLGKLLLRPNHAQWWIISMACLSFLVIEQTEFLRLKFGFAQLDTISWLYLLGSFILCLIWFEFTKSMYHLLKPSAIESIR